MVIFTVKIQNNKKTIQKSDILQKIFLNSNFN